MHTPDTLRRSCGGFALIEILIAIGLMAIVSVGISQFFSRQSAMDTRMSALANVEQVNLLTMERL